MVLEGQVILHIEQLPPYAAASSLSEKPILLKGGVLFEGNRPRREDCRLAEGVLGGSGGITMVSITHPDTIKGGQGLPGTTGERFRNAFPSIGFEKKRGTGLPERL